MAKRTNRVAWGLAVVLAVALVGGTGLLLKPWLSAYRIAKDRGYKADLHNAVLMWAPLRGSILTLADLKGANLHGANLSYSSLAGAHLNGANLTGVDLSGSSLVDARLSGASLRRATLQGTVLTGACYDTHTRWPQGFDPVKAGAVKVR